MEMLGFTHKKCLWKSLRLWGNHIVTAYLCVYACGFHAIWRHCIFWHCWIRTLKIYVISYLTHIRVYSNLRSVCLNFCPSSFLPSLFILLSSFVGLVVVTVLRYGWGKQILENRACMMDISIHVLKFCYFIKELKFPYHLQSSV